MGYVLIDRFVSVKVCWEIVIIGFFMWCCQGNLGLYVSINGGESLAY